MGHSSVGQYAEGPKFNPRHLQKKRVEKSSQTLESCCKSEQMQQMDQGSDLEALEANGQSF